MIIVVRERVVRDVYDYNRREKNKALGRCINHPLGTRGKPHGPPVSGHVRCQQCIDVYNRSR